MPPQSLYLYVDMCTIKQLQTDIKLNQEYKNLLSQATFKIFEIRSKYLTSLKEHYQAYTLHLGFECCKAEIECFTVKSEYMTQQLRRVKMVEKLHRLNEEKALLNEKISSVETRLDRFRSLDPALLAEHRELNDDLECQEMLIQISEANMEG